MYEEHFGLTKKPFQLSPDAQFFFPSEEHRRALSFLQYGLSQGDGFIIITGNVGTGKTTLVQALLAELDEAAEDSDLSVATIVSSNLDQNDLLQSVAHNFGVHVRDPSKATLLRELEHNFTQQAKARRRILLIVDEAQNLPPESVEELRMLSNFQMSGRPLVQIFLLGQQEFRATLLSEGFEQLRQRVIATYHLKPLSEVETRTYIEHRLAIAGWRHNPRFTDETFPAIFSFCEGVPRRLNNLCDRLLLYAFLEELDTIDAEVVNKVSEEIGSEFFGGLPEVADAAAVLEAGSNADASASKAATGAPRVFDSPDIPLENVARGIFDKADVQNRLTALERAVDALGHQVKPELNEIREELSFLRLMLEDVLHEVRSGSRSSGGAKAKTEAQKARKKRTRAS